MLSSASVKYLNKVIQIAAFIECLLCAWHFSKCFLCINSFNPYNSLLRERLFFLISSMMKLKQQSSKQLRRFEITHLGSGRAWMSLLHYHTTLPLQSRGFLDLSLSKLYIVNSNQRIQKVLVMIVF